MQTQVYMNIRLEDIVPQGSSFSLAKTGKTYRLNPITLADEIWLNETFGEKLQDVFQQSKMKDICRIAFHQMVEEDKVEFSPKDVIIMNELGETVTHRIGGAQLLFVSVTGPIEKRSIFQALLETLGISRPMLAQMTESEKKSDLDLKPTGEKSLTSSPQNTDGPASTSLPGPLVKSPYESMPSQDVRI